MDTLSVKCKHPWDKLITTSDTAAEPMDYCEVVFCMACCSRLGKAEVQRSRFLETMRLGNELALAEYDLHWGCPEMHMAAYQAAFDAYQAFTVSEYKELPI
jgi:hypothetical protein